MSVYLVAHQDDWQLFMEPLLSADLLDPSCKTVIIHTTAGDAGLPDAYWQARETAAVQSAAFRFSELGSLPPHTATVTLQGRTHRRDELHNAVVYFLRLPDGNKDGSGFARQQYGSLEKLRRNTITSLSTVDRSAVYESFDDIAGQVRAILAREKYLCDQIIESDKLTLNSPEYDEGISPRDHSDHYATGYLGTLLRPPGKGAHRLFTHYATRHQEEHLVGNALFWKTGMFVVYTQVVLQESGYSTLAEQSHYQRWCTATAVYREM